MTKKGKRIMWILIGVAVFLLLQWLFIGYRFSFGPFKGLGDIRMAKMRRLEAEREEWMNTFRKSSHIVPEVKHILTVKIDG